MEEAEGKRKEEIATVEFVQTALTNMCLGQGEKKRRNCHRRVCPDRLDQHVPRPGDVQEGGGRAYPRHGGPQGRQESRPRSVPLHGEHHELDELPEALEHSFGSSRGETCQSRKQPTQREDESFSI